MMQLQAALHMLCLLGVHAFPSYQDELPNRDKVTGCNDSKIIGGIGHINREGRGTRNQFGKDFAAQGYKWTVALCQMDSDNDTITNGAELGDPDCEWSKVEPAKIPKFTTGITHPGEDCGTPPNPEPDLVSMELRRHGFLMILAWGLLLPTGTMMPLFWRKALPNSWFLLHQFFQISGIVVSLGAAYFAYSGVQDKHFQVNPNGPHKLSGLIINVVALVQLIMGFCRPHKPEGEEPFSPLRCLWLLGHRLTGLFLIVAGIWQSVNGTMLVGELQVPLGGSIAVALLVGAMGCWLSSREPSDEKHEDNAVEMLH